MTLGIWLMKMFYNFMFGYHENCGTICLTYAPLTLMQINWVCCTKSLQQHLTLCHKESRAKPWTIVHQAPRACNFPGKNTGVNHHFILQGIFLTQGSNLCLLSPALAGEFFTTESLGRPPILGNCTHFNIIPT